MHKILLPLLVTLLLLTTSPDSPSQSIAFATNRDGNYEIYTITQNGKTPKNITRNPAQDRDPVWSFDGTKIAFTSDRDGNYEIYIMNPDGTDQERLTFNPRSDRYPTWSPDGKKIAFTSDRDFNDEIYVIDIITKIEKRLTRNLSFDSRASWSPDGTKIAYDSSGLRQNRYPYDIYTMDTNGKNQKNLTNYIDRNSDPAWSPDGTKIAFVKRTKNSYNIFVMDADGKNQVNVTNNSFKNWDPAWSPDGQKIIFSSDKPLITLPSDYRTTIDPPRDIYILDLTTKTLKRLTNDENNLEDDIFDDTYPSWCYLKDTTPPNYRTVIAILLLSTLLILFIFLKKNFSKT